MNILKLVIAGSLVGLVGCAGAVPWNAQNYAGLTHVDVEWKEDSPELERVRVWHGKEGTFNVTARLPDGSEVIWEGLDVKAFEGFKSRAEVETYVAEKFADAAPEIKSGLVDALSVLSGL